MPLRKIAHEVISITVSAAKCFCEPGFLARSMSAALTAADSPHHGVVTYRARDA
jgi:hypothetical protein